MSFGSAGKGGGLRPHKKRKGFGVGGKKAKGKRRKQTSE